MCIIPTKNYVNVGCSLIVSPIECRQKFSQTVLIWDSIYNQGILMMVKSLDCKIWLRTLGNASKTSWNIFLKIYLRLYTETRSMFYCTLREILVDQHTYPVLHQIFCYIYHLTLLSIRLIRSAEFFDALHLIFIIMRGFDYFYKHHLFFIWPPIIK